MNISVEIKSPELAQAILALASALGGKKETEFEQITNQGIAALTQSQQQTQQVPNTFPVQQQAPTAVPTAPPVQQYQPPVQQAPQQVPVQQQPVPTSAPTYTMDQLAVAATQLMDAGKQQELLGLLGSFGAQSLMALPQEQYGNFATKLREMGAQI